MKTSIVVPIYNCEKYIAECFYSILNQTEKNIEAIFVDDYSTDNSVDILQKLIDVNSMKSSIDFKIIRHEKNLNVSAARNTGIANTSGDFIMFLDSDDIITPDSVELMLGKAKKYPTADIILGGVISINEVSWSKGLSPDMSKHIWDLVYKEVFCNHTYKQNKGDPEVLSNNADEILRFFLSHWIYKNLILLCGVYATLYKTDFIKNNNLSFSDELYQAEDIYFRYLCFKYATQAVIEYMPVYLHRHRVDSLSNSAGEQYRKRLCATFAMEKISRDLVNRDENSHLLAIWMFKWIKGAIEALKTEKLKTLVPRYSKILEKIKPFL